MIELILLYNVFPMCVFSTVKIKGRRILKTYFKQVAIYGAVKRAFQITTRIIKSHEIRQNNRPQPVPGGRFYGIFFFLRQPIKTLLLERKKINAFTTHNNNNKPCGGFQMGNCESLAAAMLTNYKLIKQITFRIRSMFSNFNLIITVLKFDV